MWTRSLVLLCLCRFGYALQCLSCDSRFDPNCATLMKNTTSTFCDEEETECSTWIAGTSTHRGCASERDEDISNFASCSSDLCNNEIFPKDRLKCIACLANSTECVSPSADLVSPCRNYVENDKCYSYLINATSVIRGCMSDDNDNVATCQSADELCEQCSEEFCNFQSGSSEIECIACLSDENSACGFFMPLDRNLVTHVCKELASRDNFCVAFRNGSTYHRGCLSDFPAVSVESCLESDDCALCEENLCNNKQLIEDECFECDSRAGNCENVEIFNQSAVVCRDVTEEKAGCYHYDKDNIISRGCISSLSENELQSCTAEESCKLCQGGKCNSREKILKCFSCNSQNDLNCVTTQRELPEKICDSYMDTCKVFVRPNMTTHRGCSRELESAPECPSISVNCRQCDEPLCNGGIFPSTRLSCHHCVSSTDLGCSEEITHLAISHPCEKYNFRDSCYLYLDANNVTVRGCLSDSNVYTDLCTSNASHCDICTTPNCNGKSVQRAASLACIKCDSMGDPKCIWGFSESAAMPCQRDLYFYEEESCFTFYVSHSTVIRQCTLDSNVCRGNPRCALCSTSACNAEQKTTLHCHQCSSEESAACLNDVEVTQNVSCQGPVTFENRGCFTWRNSSSGGVSRGCVSSLTAAKKFQCSNDNDCEICVDGQNCNDRALNGGEGVGIGGLLILVTIVIILRNS